MISDNESPLEPPLDLLILEELRRELGGQDAAGFREVVDTFISDATFRLEALQEAASLGQAADIQEAAHALRGTSGYFGARKIQRLCLQIESLIETRELGKASHPLGELKREFERVRQALHAMDTHGLA
jgi:HPt (histidine-containing phosphotransfer) domain-containing protein